MVKTLKSDKPQDKKLIKETLLERKRIIKEQLSEYAADPSRFISEWAIMHYLCPDIKDRLLVELEGIEGELNGN